MSKRLDKPYMEKNLKILLRDIKCYKPNEFSRALLRLACVADPLILSEPEFMTARMDAALSHWANIGDKK